MGGAPSGREGTGKVCKLTEICLVPVHEFNLNLSLMMCFILIKAMAKRQTRLEKLWKAKWHGALELKEKKSEQATSPSSPRKWSWETAFGLIEGHRFIWWRSEKHFDTGEAPLGQIFFAGHSGLAGLSPLELRELSMEEIPFVVSIFGRGSQMQQKITLLAPSSDIKDSLENAVLAASMDAKAD